MIQWHFLLIHYWLSDREQYLFRQLCSHIDLLNLYKTNKSFIKHILFPTLYETGSYLITFLINTNLQMNMKNPSEKTQEYRY